MPLTDRIGELQDSKKRLLDSYRGLTKWRGAEPSSLSRQLLWAWAEWQNAGQNSGDCEDSQNASSLG